MADFRKLFLALIAGALLFGTAASAADFACTVTAVPTVVRAEGVADIAGDVLLTCSGTLPQILQQNGLIANIRLQVLGARVTSKLLSGATADIGGSSPPVSEATLLLDDTHPWVPCSSTVGSPTFHPYCSGGIPVVPDPTMYAPKGYVTAPTVPYADGSQNVYQAVQVANDTVEWQGVVLVGPNSNLDQRTIRLTNVRVLPQVVVGQSIQARVNIIAPTSIPLTPTNIATIADVLPGLIVSYDPLTIDNCRASTDATITGSFNVNLREGYAMAFKPRWNNWLGGSPPPAIPHWVPGAGYLDESGYNPRWSSVGVPPTGSGAPLTGNLVAANSIGVATAGTKFRAVVVNVPVGVTLTAVSGTSTNGLTYSASQSVSTSGGLQTYTFTWEVTGYASPATAQYLNDTIVAVINVVANNPAPVTVNPVNAHSRFWPHSTPIMFASPDSSPETDDVPRFQDSTADYDRQVLIVTQNCRTILLFPYLVQFGSSWDTGIAISNTSKDPFGTVNQTGACTLNFYGQANSAALTSGQAVQTTPAIPAGGQYVGVLSAGGSVLNPDGTSTATTAGTLLGFRGYMIATCQFQYAHGFAFVSDFGSQKLAQGYLALVIPDRPSMQPNVLTGRPAQNAGLGALPNQGEQLGN